MRSPWRSRRLPPRKEIQAVASSANKFAFQAMQTLAQRDKDFLFSPLSAYIGLALTPSLFVGETRAEIMKALGCKPSQSVPQFSRRVQTLITTEEDNHMSLYGTVLANSILHWPPNAFNVINDSFRSRVINKPFPGPACEAANTRCKEATHGSIESIIDPSDLPAGDSCALLSTVWFEDEWLHPFSDPVKIDWHNLDGSITQVDGMLHPFFIGVSYLEKDNIETLMVPYTDDRTMIIMLPANVADFNPAVVTEEFFKEHLPKEEASISFCVTLPKWSFETDAIDVTRVCQSLGARRLWGSEAEGIPGVFPYFIHQFVQKLVIHCTERGTVAGAVTRLAGGIMGQLGVFVADRPFYYAILNKTTNVIEFIGCVVEPKFSLDGFSLRSLVTSEQNK